VVHLVRRLVLGVAVLFVLSFASFCFFASRGDTYPTGRPVLTEYWTWLKGLFNGDSLQRLTQPVPTTLNHQPTTMLEAVGHTALLLGGALVLVTLLSVAIAVAAATTRGSALDLLLRCFTYLAWAMPAFLLALVVQRVFYALGDSFGFGPFPLAGWPGSCPAGLGIDAGTLPNCPSAGSGLRYGANLARYMTLPILTLAIGFVGLHARYLRSALIGTLDAPFITTARAKGLSERRIVLRHALRASLVTFVAVLLADFGAIFGAAMAVDWIFELNGLGTVLVSEFPISSPSPTDTYSVQLVLLLTGGLVLLTSYLSEFAVGWLDPRMRVEK